MKCSAILMKIACAFLILLLAAANAVSAAGVVETGKVGDAIDALNSIALAEFARLCCAGPGYHT